MHKLKWQVPRQHVCTQPASSVVLLHPVPNCAGGLKLATCLPKVESASASHAHWKNDMMGLCKPSLAAPSLFMYRARLAPNAWSSCRTAQTQWHAAEGVAGCTLTPGRSAGQHKGPLLPAYCRRWRVLPACTTKPDQPAGQRKCTLLTASCIRHAGLASFTASPLSVCRLGNCLVTTGDCRCRCRCNAVTLLEQDLLGLQDEVFDIWLHATGGAAA